MSFIPSPLLNDILISQGLTQVATPDTIKTLSFQEKERIYEIQKEVIRIFREKSTREITKLRDEVSLYSPPPRPRVEKQIPQVKSSEIKKIEQIPLENPIPNKTTPKTLQAKPSRRAVAKSSLVKAIPFFDASQFNRKTTRPIVIDEEPPPPPKKIHYDSLEQRPRFVF